MKWVGLAVLVLLTLVGGPPSASQTTIQEAREQGRELADEKRHDASIVPSDEAQARIVPGYTGPTTPQSGYFDDPDRLVAEASAQAAAHPGYQAATDPDRLRATFSAAELRATTARATAVAADPATYLAGESIGATSGSCVPLPPGSGAAGWYEATCNTGTRIEERTQSCSPRMVAHVVSTLRYFYYGVSASQTAYGFASIDYLNAKVAAGVCQPAGIITPICDAQVELGAGGSNPTAYLGFCRRNVSGNATLFSCNAELPRAELADHFNFATGTVYVKTEGEYDVSVVRDDSSCSAFAADSLCTEQPPDVCAEGAETRTIDGVAITQACWAWRRAYLCHVATQANDCGELEHNRQCSYLRTDCLDDPPSGPCRVSEKVYRCPVPSNAAAPDRQYICGNDVYCINGDCEPIVREASTEFRDALVGLHALGQAGKELNEADLTVFSGTRETCHKPIFGLVNCCAGRSSGLLTAAAGGAALAGGPAAIAALATPFLSVFLCGQDEMRLDIKDRMGFCHNLGTYCSGSILGICTTKRTAYCCFESKLSRVLQEQGRPQIGKPWGTPKREQCRGFTVDEFARLDLSRVDFTEVYAEFLDGARLPDEVQTMAQMQAKIGDYYALHGRFS